MDFTPEFRAKVAGVIKIYGHKFVEAELLKDGLHPSFVKGLIKSIMRKEGW